MVLLSLRREEQGKVGLRYGLLNLRREEQGKVGLNLRREEQGKVGLRYGPTKSSQRRVG